MKDDCDIYVSLNAYYLLRADGQILKLMLCYLSGHFLIPANGIERVLKSLEFQLPVYSGFQLLNGCNPRAVFASANSELSARGLRSRYRVHVVTMTHGAVPSSADVGLNASALPRRSGKQVDTLIVPGGAPMQTVLDHRIEHSYHWIRQNPSRMP